MRLELVNVLPGLIENNSTCFLNGKRHGVWKFYHNTGKLQAIKHYENGQLHGPYMEFYNEVHKKIKVKGAYAMGRKTGLWKTYNNKGICIQKEYFNAPEPSINV